MNAADGSEVLHHLLADLLWKAGIVAALVVLAVVAAVLVWKRVR